MKNAAYMLLLVWVWLACGCDERSELEGQLDDYLTRIENITETTRPAADTTALLPFPRRRDMVISTDDTRIGLLDFFSLDVCNLQVLVAERNNGMGKVMPPSQRLIYEHRFLSRADACRSQLGEDPAADSAFVAQLTEIIAVKRANAPRLLWNATIASPEFEKMMSLSGSALSMEALESHAADVNDALISLSGLVRRFGQPGVNPDPAPIEKYYQLLQRGRLGGNLLRAMQLLTDYLNDVAALLEQRLDRRPICFEGKPGQEATRLLTVFRKYYRSGVQPSIAKVHQVSRMWLESMDALLKAQLNEMPAVFQAYHARQLSLAAPDGMWGRFERAIQRHTNAWQRVMDACGFVPGS